jgi:hypothetical protein
LVNVVFGVLCAILAERLVGGCADVVRSPFVAVGQFDYVLLLQQVLSAQIDQSRLFGRNN